MEAGACARAQGREPRRRDDLAVRAGSMFSAPEPSIVRKLPERCRGGFASTPQGAPGGSFDATTRLAAALAGVLGSPRISADVRLDASASTA